MLFILLPIGHEHHTVRRWPHVSLAILALNFLMFSFTYLRASDYGMQGGERAANAVVTYVLDRPYLTLGEEFQKHVLTPEGRKELAQMLEVRRASVQTPPPAALAREQAELDRLCRVAVESFASSWVMRYGFRATAPSLFTLLTSMFTHAGWGHLLGNMLFFYLTGPFLEDVFGRPIFAALYLTGGAAAGLMQMAKFPDSPAPLIGASGAIAALMGAFLVRFFRTRIRFLFIFLPALLRRRGFPTFWAPAYIMLPLWLLQTLWDAWLFGESGGVAFWAHIGGFVYGAAAALAIKLWKVEETYVAPAIESSIGLERHPGLTRGIEAREAGKLKQARFYLEQAAKAVPDDPDVALELFRTTAALGDPGAARTHALRVLAVELKANRAESAWETWKEASETLPDLAPPPAQMIALARLGEKNGDDLGALAIYEKVAARVPGDPVAARALGQAAAIHARQHEPHLAVEALRRALHVPKLDADVAREMDARLREIAAGAGLTVPAVPRIAPKGAPPPVRGPAVAVKPAPAPPAAAPAAAAATPVPAPSAPPPVLGPPVARKRGA